MTQQLNMVEIAQLAEESLHSIFSVEVTLMHHIYPSHKKAKQEYYRKTSLVDPTLPKTPKEEAEAEAEAIKAAKKAKAKAGPELAKEPEENPSPSRNDGTRNSTGFVVATSDNGEALKILTCAHTMEECYASDVDLNVEEANLFFYFEVTCSHQEMDVHKNLGMGEISQQLRLKTRASCVALDVNKDLMVLQIRKKEIWFGSNEDGDDTQCKEENPVIDMVNANPNKLECCILQGWPPQCIECYNVGYFSFGSRTYPAITQLNPKGYSMRLADFSGMASVAGCSGGPIISLNRQCLGVYHGVVGGMRGYAVNVLEVKEFLARFNVFTQWLYDDDGDDEVSMQVQQGAIGEQAGASAAGQEDADDKVHIQQGALGEQPGAGAAGQGAAGAGAGQDAAGAGAGPARVLAPEQYRLTYKRRKKTDDDE